MCQVFVMTEKYQGLREFLTEGQIASLPNQLKGQSWAFEPYLRLTNDHVQNVVDLMLDDLCVAWMGSYPDRVPGMQAQQHFIDCANVIMANLLRARCMGPDQTVGIYRRKDRLDRERRYRAKFMTANRFIMAQNWLVELDQMRMVQKGYNFGKEGQTTRVALTDNAAKALEASELTVRDFHIGRPDDCILLKDNDDQLCRYEDTDETAAMRTALDRINALLDATDISISRSLAKLDRGQQDTGRRVNLVRLFHYGSFETGGRFYGGWWQSLKKYVRPFILLDGVATVEADYRGFNPAILLAKSGQPIPDDPYSIIPGVSDCAELRGHAKTTLAALLNSKSGRTRQPEGFDTGKHGMTDEGFRRSVHDAFPMLGDLLGKNTGMKLQREESDLAERVLLHFVDQGQPILPIHDAFIVQEHLKDELVQVMQDTFKARYGQTPPVKVTFPI
jgi:hypothetical protein